MNTYDDTAARFIESMNTFQRVLERDGLLWGEFIVSALELAPVNNKSYF